MQIYLERLEIQHRNLENKSSFLIRNEFYIKFHVSGACPIVVERWTGPAAITWQNELVPAENVVVVLLVDSR